MLASNVTREKDTEHQEATQILNRLAGRSHFWTWMMAVILSKVQFVLQINWSASSGSEHENERHHRQILKHTHTQHTESVSLSHLVIPDQSISAPYLPALMCHSVHSAGL